VIESGLRAWKEGREAVEVMDPLILAGGISYEVAVSMDKEALEAIESFQEFREHLRVILEQAA
jgi:hypothetical protein